MTNNTKIIAESKNIRKKVNISQKISPYEISEYILSFFMNKISLFGTLSPFGISYFAATFPSHELSLGTICAFLGILLSGFGISCLKYIGALSLYLIFMLLYNKDVSEKMWVSGLAGTLSLFISGTIFVIMEGFLLYDMLLLVLESILCFVSFFAFSNSSLSVRTFKTRKVFESADVLSIVFLFATFLISVMTINGMQPVAEVVAVGVILLIAYSNGFYLSSSAGVLFGIVMSINTPLPAQVICTYTISSLCAGLLKNYGKLGVSFGFLAANAIMMIYLNSSTVTIINFICTAFASLILFLIPKSFIDKASEFISTPIITYRSQNAYCEKDIISQKLMDSSDSLFELSKLFSVMTDKATKTNELSPGAIFDMTIDSVCKDCNLCTFCWHKNYDESIKMVKSMYSKMSERGYAIEFDAPTELRTQCIRFDDFLEAVNKNYEIQKINISWASKVLESRNIVSEQFRNISSVLSNLGNQVKHGFSRDHVIESKIKAELDKKGLFAKDVKVICADFYEVMLTIDESGKERSCRDLITTVIGSVLGVPVYIESSTHSESDYFFKFCEKPRFSAETGFAKTSDILSGQSGDSHLYSPLPDGRYVMCLSDGMGRGKDASIQSKMTVNLIKRLLSLGFDKETTLKIINTFLLFKSQKETFATADVCVLNLHSGTMEFIKSGAENTYIKSKNNVTKVKCTSLPAGTISKLDADCELSYAKDGDFIVMATDGVTELLETKEQNLIKQIIENYSGTTSQELADKILKAAMQQRTNSSFDDMTVLVSKITEEM